MGVLILGYIFLVTVGSALIKTINPERTLWVSGQMKSGVYLWVKKNPPHPAFPSNFLPVTGGKPGLFYVKFGWFFLDVHAPFEMCFCFGMLAADGSVCFGGNQSPSGSTA